MKKKEFVHLHQLLNLVKDQYEEWGVYRNTSVYDELGVAPTSIHRSKQDQKEAVFSLVHDLNDTGRAEQVLEQLADPSNTITWQDALDRLEAHSEPLNDSEPRYASVELDKTTIDSLGLQPYRKLNRLRDEGLITPPQRMAPGTPREEYGPGSEIYLLD